MHLQLKEAAPVQHWLPHGPYLDPTFISVIIYINDDPPARMEKIDLTWSDNYFI